MQKILLAFIFLSITAGSSLADALSSNLVAYLPFNNSAADISGNGNHGTVDGAMLTTDRFGNVNSAYHFDGVNDIISISDNDMFTVTDVSIATWIRTTDKSDYKHITSCWSGASPSDEWYNLYLQPEVGYAKWAVDPGGYGSVPYTLGTTDVADGQWHFLVGVRDTSTTQLKLYVDGVLEQTASDTATESLDPTVDFWIGGQYAFPSRNFNGDIDDVRIYNKVLTQSEVTSLYVIPEPSSILLLGFSMAGFFLYRRGQRQL